MPAGSVGIGGPYTGIYPEETPGGWRLIGRAPVRLFDAGRNPPALLLPGDSVRFEPIGREEFERRRAVLERAGPAARRDGLGSPSLSRHGSPGVFTSVQGGPRRGWAMYGVPPGGAMDLDALAAGNAAVGNPPSAPALEMTLVGPELEVLADAADRLFRWVARADGQRQTRRGRGPAAGPDRGPAASGPRARGRARLPVRGRRPRSDPRAAFLAAARLRRHRLSRGAAASR